MDFHRPSVRAARARQWPGSARNLWLPAFGLAAALTIAGCGSSSDEDSASADDVDLPAELVAADADDDTTDGDGRVDTGDGVSGDEGDAFGGPEGSEVAIEDVETVPAEPIDTDSVELSDDAPAAVIEKVADEIAGADESEAGDELLDAVDPVDGAEQPPSEPDGRSRNGYGELLVLDEEASLACANVEIAIGQLDEGRSDAAGDHVRSGAERAEASGIADIRSWADPLRAAAGVEAGDPAALIGFLTVCTEGGYEL